MDTLLTLESAKLHYIGRSIENPHQIAIRQGITVVAGQNGSGKSTLGAIIERGRNLATNRIVTPDGGLVVKRIEFTDIHSLTGNKVEYHQQRYESMANDEIPTVGELFSDRIETPRWRELERTLRISHTIQKRINFLSSGELRKLLIAVALTDDDMPGLLILDNPYIGLDSRSRKVLDDILPELAAGGTSVMMMVCDPADVPDYADSLITMENMTLTGRYDRGESSLRDIAARLFDFAVDTSALPRPADRVLAPDAGEEIVRLESCTVRYASAVILTDVNWTIRRGERWALAGPNGSGKSTLLSLIHADNPQVYANKVSLFGRRRGTGESIWDVKRRIGYVSPEMHLYFNAGSCTALEVIARGLMDTVGFFTRLGERELTKARRWVRLLHIEDIADCRFTALSSGQQRMVLLARTLIKNPELLILDEPLHGLDSARKRAVRAIVNTLAARDGTTLIYVTHCPDEVPECVYRTLTLQSAQR